MEGKKLAKVAIKIFLGDIAKDEKGIKLKPKEEMDDQLKNASSQMNIDFEVFCKYIEALIRYNVELSFNSDKQIISEQFAQLLLLGMDEDVAYHCTKLHFKNRGFFLGEKSARKVGQIAKDTGINTNDLKCFFKKMIHDITDELFQTTA